LELARIDAILRQEGVNTAATSVANQNNQAWANLNLGANQFDIQQNRLAILDAMGVHL
jgi:hypothetical protein